ncbi:hypothetical protein ACIP69_14790 [Streptomyces hygroscopicus]|uniref:SCO2400 family protein n=1 Tax=Streptomyces hygroscopicus TaxID=1912 RepID=UPI0037F1F62E
MDYCSSCRRHLNGASFCPGCGNPIADLGPPPTAPVAPVMVDAPDAPDAPVMADAPVAPDVVDTAHTPTPSRVSRRKPKSRGVLGLFGHRRARRARRGRGRRVTILAAVLGPVLAAVFVAELATEGHWRESSPAPRRQEPVGADRSGGATDPAESATRETGGPSAVPSAESGGRGEDGDTAAGEGEDGGRTEGGNDGAPSGPDGASSSGPPDASAPSAPGGPGASQWPTTPANPGPTAPPTDPPTPDPTPTENCFLWWCV